MRRIIYYIYRVRKLCCGESRNIIYTLHHISHFKIQYINLIIQNVIYIKIYSKIKFYFCKKIELKILLLKIIKPKIVHTPI
jgi:hypothetical protein